MPKMKGKYDSELPFIFGNKQELTLENAKQIIMDSANNTSILDILCFLVDEVQKLSDENIKLKQIVTNLTPF